MDKSADYGSMSYPETPVKLPTKKSTPEYGSDVMADLISAMGFKHIFVLPGSSFRGLHDSIVNHLKNKNPEMIMANHEAIVVAMAHGYAKATGEASACIVHDLVGLMCGTVGVFDAWVDRVPVVVFGGSGPQDPARRRPIDWTHTASMQCDIVKPFAKWTAEPVTLQSTVDCMLRAKKIACSEPMGPTYVSLDLGVQEEKLPEELFVPDANLPRFQPPAPMAANAESLGKAVEMLLLAENPLIVAGRIGRKIGASKVLTELVELTGAAYVEDRAVVCLPTSHPQNLNGHPSIRKEADVILAIDCADPTTVSDSHNADIRGRSDQKIIEVTLENLYPSSWSNAGGPQGAIELTLECDPISGMHQIIHAIKSVSSFQNKVADRKKMLAKMHLELRGIQQAKWADTWDKKPINGGRLTHELYQAVKDKDWILVVRNHRSFPEAFWDFTKSGQYLGADGGGGVGYGPAAAVGAALALRNSGKFPVAIVGDGDFQMGSGAVWTAVHYQIPLLIVINNNNSWGNDEIHQRNIARRRGRPVENAWIGQRMTEPATDYAQMVRSYGGWAEGPVTDPAELSAVFARAVAIVEKGMIAVVDVRTGL